MKPIFPFSVHLPNHPSRRSIRILRWVSYFLSVLFVLTALFSFIFLVLVPEKNLIPRFISFNPKTHSFFIVPASNSKQVIEKEAVDVLREKFVRDYVLARETWNDQMADNHHRLCNCLEDQREKNLIKATRNRSFEPRCRVCLMSAQNVYLDFSKSSFLARKEKAKTGWTQSPLIQKLSLFNHLPSEYSGALIYQVDYLVEDISWTAFVSVVDRPLDKVAPEDSLDYLFAVSAYGVLKGYVE